MTKYIFTIILIASFCNLKAQQINGYVTDKISGESLIGAHVYASLSKAFAVTNAFGFFSIRLQKSDTLIISYVGYKKKEIPYATIIKIPLQVKLKAETSINEVLVTAHKSIQELPEMGLISIPIQQLKTIPSIAGESDIMKTLQLMPGIKATGEGQSSFMVRGGSPDQNMIILDNVPLYYVNHLGGFVSIFNTDALSDVKMYKGAFPARYGGRLSSVINVNTKNGNLKKRRASFTLGLITTKLLFEGPIKKDTLSYFLSARRFMYDIISRPITYFSNDKKQWGYTFYDVNAKINYKPNNNNRLYLSFYTGNDKMLSKKKENDDEESLMNNTSKWGNLSTSLRWNHIYGSKLFSNISLYYMHYKYNSAFEYSFKDESNKYSTTSTLRSGINDFGLNTDFEYYVHPKISFQYGSNHIYHTYKPNNYEYSQPQINQDSSTQILSVNKQKTWAFENSIYGELEFYPLKYLSFNIGYRLTAFTTTTKTYISKEPRALINVNFPKLFSIKASYARMSQYVHLLTYYGASIPADLWMPVTETAPPQYSDIYSLGVYKELLNNNVAISIEGYYKKLSNLIDFKPGYNIFSSSQDWTNAIEQNGTGESKGIEFLLQRKTGKLAGWVSYTLSETTRQFANINNGKSYFYTYDATHDIAIVGNYKIKDNLSFSATWTYMTGRAITIPNEYYETPQVSFDYIANSSPNVNYSHIANSYEQKNSVRMAPYHRLDISLTYKKHKKRSDRILTVGVYNLYNRQNAVYYYVGTKDAEDEMGRPTGKSEKAVYQMSMFPFLPSISYTWVW